MVIEVADTNNLLSAVVNGERHYTDGKQHYIEREHSVLEYIGPLSEASDDVIAGFITDNSPPWEK